ncbi:MAG: cation:proton antiporter [Patescibacteria group bacterium]|nr:cation:proton antiporter [Patescibacteria group bacterium]
MASGFLELAIIVCLAAVLGYLARVLKQPTILGYLAAGAVLGVFESSRLLNFDTFQVFSDLGIMFLLFLVGLEINYTQLRLVGKSALIVGLGQIVFTFLLGYGVCWLLGFAPLAAAYVSIALTFSSTIIVIKLLSDKRDLGSLYGKMSLGILLTQDIVAVLILVVLSGLRQGGELSVLPVIWTLTKAVGLFALMFVLGRKIFPPLFDRVAQSHELLFTTSLAWMFLLAAIVSRIGFSIEIAGFLAGLALANSSEHFQIAANIRPLRDFFMLIFFAILGASIAVFNPIQAWLPVVVLSLFVLIGNPLIVLVIMGFLGYRKRTSFLTGITIAQISEFSLVLAALGLKLGHIGESTVSIITSVGVISILVSSYLVMHGDAIYRRVCGALSLFERKHLSENHLPKTRYNKPIVVIGYHRTGRAIVKSLPKKDVLIIDFDPEMVESLRDLGYDHIFGDIIDSEVLELANLANARLVISTSPDLQDNLALLSVLAEQRRRPKLILRADSEKDAGILYAHGASYVLVPHISSGHYLGKLVASDPTLKNLGKFIKALA